MLRDKAIAAMPGQDDVADAGVWELTDIHRLWKLSRQKDYDLLYDQSSNLDHPGWIGKDVRRERIIEGFVNAHVFWRLKRKLRVLDGPVHRVIGLAPGTEYGRTLRTAPRQSRRHLLNHLAFVDEGRGAGVPSQHEVIFAPGAIINLSETWNALQRI